MNPEKMQSIYLQKQIKDNADDMRLFCEELKQWGEDAKRKDQQLRTGSLSNKVEAVKEAMKIEKPSSKIGFTDYSKWDKFDQDGAPDEDTNANSVEIRRHKAFMEKDQGNNYVRNKEWDKAIRCYNRAIEFYPHEALFYANRALCHLRKGDVANAEHDCTISIQLDNKYVKAYQRRAAAREAMNKLYEAKADLLEVLKLEPKNKESMTALDILKTKLGEYVNPPDLSEQRPVSKFTVSRKNTVIPKNPMKFGKDVDDSKGTSWPERGNIIEIKAVQKSPHTRSKRPLKRIDIEEIDVDVIDSKPINTSGNTFINKKVVEKMPSDFKSALEFEKKENLKNLKCRKFDPATTSESTEFNINKMQIIERKEVKNDSLSKSDKNIKNITLSNKTTGNLVNIDLVPPTTSVQFRSTWNNLTTSFQKYVYLKLIPPPSIPKIFDESLENSDISSILEVLVEHHIEKNEPIFEILQNLAQVKRFDILSLFMSDDDKNKLVKLMFYAIDKEQTTKEEIETLVKSYNIKLFN